MDANATPALQPITESKPIEFMYNPMTNYSKADWDGERLTMKSTGIDYINWRKKIDDHFDHVEQLLTSAFKRRVFRLKDAVDAQWINYIDTHIRANSLKPWEEVEAAMIYRMDEIFPKMKRMTTTIGLKQKPEEDLFTFLSRLQIAQDSVDWENWPKELRDAANVFMRLEDNTFRD